MKKAQELAYMKAQKDNQQRLWLVMTAYGCRMNILLNIIKVNLLPEFSENFQNFPFSLIS